MPQSPALGEAPQQVRSTKTTIAFAGWWALAVIFFASQWYAYDASRSVASAFLLYLWWSAYLWTLVTPSALVLAKRFPITTANWRRSVALHLAASVALMTAQLSLEAYLGWLHHGGELSTAQALRHYFGQHAQISLLTYWLVVAAVLHYAARDRARASSVRSARLESQLAGARLEVLRRQLQPHFLFNTLQAASTLVHEDPDRAEEVLVRLSELLRISVYESQAHEIPLSRELAILEHYTGIQVCRFQDRLDFHVSVDPQLLNCLVPSMLLQPLVENAVRHGVEKHRIPDTITIRAAREGGFLLLSVCNSSSSLDRVSSGETAGRRGHGLPSTRARLEQLYGAGASSFQLRAVQPSGVCAEVRIPVRAARGLAEQTTELTGAYPSVHR